MLAYPESYPACFGRTLLLGMESSFLLMTPVYTAIGIGIEIDARELSFCCLDVMFGTIINES